MKRLFAILLTPLVFAEVTLSSTGDTLAWEDVGCAGGINDEVVLEYRIFRDGVLIQVNTPNDTRYLHGGAPGSYTVRSVGHCVTPDPALAVESADSGAVVVAACNDGLDNDSDGLIDYPDDTDCTDPLDNSEGAPPPPPPPQCSDGLDNDGDGEIDYPADDGCVSSSDDDETDPPPPPPPAQCDDGLDNDGDGLVDLADPGCVDALDDDETDPPPAGATAFHGHAFVDANLGSGSVPIAVPAGTTKIVATYDARDLGFITSPPEFRVDGAVMTSLLHQGDVGEAAAYGAQVIDATDGSVFAWDWAGNPQQLVWGGGVTLHFVAGTTVIARGAAGVAFGTISITPLGTLNLASASFRDSVPALVAPYVDDAVVKGHTYDAAIVTDTVTLTDGRPTMVVIEID